MSNYSRVTARPPSTFIYNIGTTCPRRRTLPPHSPELNCITIVRWLCTDNKRYSITTIVISEPVVHVMEARASRGSFTYSTRQKKMDGSNGTCKVSNGNVTLLLRYSKVTGKLLESYLKVTAKLLESYLNVTPAVHMTCVARGYKGGSLTQRLPVNAAPLLRFGTSPTEPSLRAETLKPSLVPYVRYGGQHYRTSRQSQAASLLSAS